MLAKMFVPIDDIGDDDDNNNNNDNIGSNGDILHKMLLDLLILV